MADLDTTFQSIHSLTHNEGQCEFLSVILLQKEELENSNSVIYETLQTFLKKLLFEIDALAVILKIDNTILISVKNQKLLWTCFQLISSLGISPCLISGLGISLSKRCTSAAKLPQIVLTDVQKYETLTMCTDFFTRSYEIPVLKKIITTLHLCDYLAALIQLSFAPLKRPGTYQDFTMTQDMYEQLTKSKEKYLLVYDYLVANCFQPTLMKELLILQSVTEPHPPAFVKRTIVKEMDRRLLSPGGVLSLIRCFLETYDVDVGFEWKKIDIVCKIVTAKHGNESLESYLCNICFQLRQILSLNNTHYLATVVSCILCLFLKYPENNHIKILVTDYFQGLDYDLLISKSNLPGTVLLSPQEVENNVNILQACVCSINLDCPIDLISSNMYLLFFLGVKCIKYEQLKIKLKETVLKCLEQFDKNKMLPILNNLFFGKVNNKEINITIDEYEAGVAIKSVTPKVEYPTKEAILYFITLFQISVNHKFIENVFETALEMLVDLDKKRQQKINREVLLHENDDIQILDDIDEKYATILQLLSEVSSSPKITSALKRNPSIVLHFIEYFILKTVPSNDECMTISLVLLNTILSNSSNLDMLNGKFINLIPALQKIAENDSDFNNILSKEALSLILSNKPSFQQTESAYTKAVSEVYNNLLPICAHGIVQLKRLIDTRDTETISKKHFVFCLFQEHLKDEDSYIYLAAINGLASLASHCTDDVLQILCKEFLEPTGQTRSIGSKNEENKLSNLRMKIGDIIVKVTKRLGEMAIVHKVLLLNTMLCACRDEDPFIRTSALSNLAEIALVLHYRIGSIIYEMLLCIWGIIETDKAIECRRAAVMVISSLLKGLGRETLVELKENLLPIYRTLKKLYSDPNEDSAVKLHAQIALEELNDTVREFLLPKLNIEKHFVS